MPSLSSPTTWRLPHTVKGYLFGLAPDVIFSALVNQASFSYPLATITYDTVSVGAYTDVVIGQTVRISNGSITKGYGYVRATPTSTQLLVGVLGQNDIDVADNDTLEVLDEFRIWAKIPRIDASNPRNIVFYKDYDLAYSDQGSKPNPKCNAGPHYAAFVDATTGLITVDFDLTNSYAIAPSATISSYAGDIQDGTVVSGTIASGTFTATFPAGKRWCHFTVTDSNSKTHTAHVLVVACERTGANAPIRIAMSNHRGSLEGWEAGFKALQNDASIATLPYNAMVIYFEEEVYGGTPGSLNGYAGREQVKFVGWLTTDTVLINPETSDLDFVAAGPIGILRTLPGFSQSVENQTSPTAWNHLKSLTLFRFIWYMLHWHTTMLDVCDLEEPTWVADYPYSRFDADQADPFTLLNQLADSVTAKLTCDRAGILYLRKNPNYMSSVDRNDVTTTLTLTDADWATLTIEERHRAPDYWLRASGLLASSSKIEAYLAIAPGSSPGQGQQEDTYDRQLVTSQSDLNARMGHVYAERNSPNPRYTAQVFRGGQVADPAWREWIVLSLDADTNRRALEFASDRFLITDLSVSHDDEQGVHSEDWSLLRETSGVPGLTYYLPVDRTANINYAPLPPFEFTLPDLVTFDPRPTSTSDLAFTGSPAMYALDYATQKMLRCRNFGSGSETWEVMWSLSDIPSTYTLESYISNQVKYVFFLDGWNPKQAMYIGVQDQNYSGSLDALELWYVENLNAPAGQQTFTRIFSKTDANQQVDWQLGVSINVNGMVGIAYIVAGIPSESFLAIRTSRSGAFSATDLGNSGGNIDFDYGKKAASGASGKLYVAMRAGDFHTHAFRSLTNGASIGSSEQDMGDGQPQFVHVPYQNNDNDNICYFGVDGSGLGLYRRNEDGSYDYIPIALAGGSSETPIAIHSYTGDRNYMMTITRPGRQLGRSTDGGSTWTDCKRPLDDIFLNPDLAGWPYDKNIMVVSIYQGANRGPYWTENLFSAAPSGITWVSALGDWETVTGATFNGATFIPVWTV